MSRLNYVTHYLHKPIPTSQKADHITPSRILSRGG